MHAHTPAWIFLHTYTYIIVCVLSINKCMEHIQMPNTLHYMLSVIIKLMFGFYSMCYTAWLFICYKLFLCFRSIGVLGAGLMGAGIVQVSIDKGYKVIMKDTTDAGLYRGLGQIETGLTNAVKRKRIAG